MHVNLTLPDIIFHGTVFGILLWNIISLINYYLIPVLYQEVCDEKNNQLEIMQKDKLLVSTRSRLENQIKLQQKNFLILDKNIQRWHRNHVLEQEKKEKENRALQQKVQSKRLMQQQHARTSALLELSIEDALHQAENELRARSAHDQRHIFTEKSIALLAQISSKGALNDSK